MNINKIFPISLIVFTRLPMPISEFNHIKPANAKNSQVEETLRILTYLTSVLDSTANSTTMATRPYL